MTSWKLRSAETAVTSCSAMSSFASLQTTAWSFTWIQTKATRRAYTRELRDACWDPGCEPRHGVRDTRQCVNILMRARSLSDFIRNTEQRTGKWDTMHKAQAVASLGQRKLMLPGWVKAALSANDRLKVYLTVLQAASSHASHPNRDLPDLAKELAAAGPDTGWLHDVAAAATQVDDDLLMPDMPRLVKCFVDDLATMARPVLETTIPGAEPHPRVQHWLDWLGALPPDRLSGQHIEALTQGRRDGPDSLHRLIMDLHKQINRLSGELASEVIDGANVWELRAEDRERVAAFMRGLNRTAALKFDHPGLDTAATRDGERLLLQNDIGTNDAHVLVLQVTARAITLTYSDLHRKRLEFFQALLAPFGAQWSGLESRTSADLNDGEAYSVATARF